MSLRTTQHELILIITMPLKLKTRNAAYLYVRRDQLTTVLVISEELAIDNVLQKVELDSVYRKLLPVCY